MIISHKKILLIMFLFFIPLVSIYAQDSTIIINVTLKLVSNSDEAIDGAKVELFSKESKSELIQRTSDKLGMCVFSMKITDLDTYTRVRVYIDNIVIHEDEISLDVTKLVKIDDNTQALPTIQLKISMPEDISKIKNQIVAGLINQARKLIATDRTEENFELALGFARQAKSTNDKQKNPDPAVDKFVAEIFEMYLQYLYSEEKVKEGLDLLAKLQSDLPNFSKLNEWQDRFNLKTLPEDVRTKYLEALNAVETGDAETAIKLFSELVKIKDTVIPYYQEIFASQLSVSQDMVVSKILEQALREYEKGDYDKALQFLSQISKYTEKVSPAALAIEEVVRQKLGINSRKETPKNNQSGFLKCELEPLGKNPQGYEEFTRSTDGMVVVMIPAREITIGDLNGIGDTDEIPTKNLKLRPFYYDKYEISNAQYCAFLNAINSRGLIVRFYNLDSVSAQIEFKNGVYSPKPGKADYPVQNISWYGSNAYSLWAWGHNWRDFEGADCLLPTDAMYECVSVCTPDKKLIYPWGDDFNQDNVVCGREKLYQWDVVPTVKTTEYTQSASYCGIMNLCGNVYEWMANAGAKTYYDNRHAEINFFLRQINSEHPKDYFVKLREHITKFMEKNKAFIEKDEGYTKQFAQMTETLDKILKDKKDDNKTEDFTLPEFLYPNDGGNEFDASNYSKVDDYTREYRGGGFTSGASKVRCTYRGRDYPSKQKHYLGFRTAIFAETLETHEIDPESLPQAKFDPIVVGFEYLGVNKQGFREFRRPKDGMVMIEVPAGDFIMGSEVVIDAKPEHLVPLDMYLIDKYEISNAQFDKFLKEYGSYRVKDGEYVDEFIIKESLWGFLKDKDGKLQIAGDKDAPVVGVTWYGAQEYAKWAKAELPSEAQWEKAARKDNTGSYAWGSEDPDETRANFNGTYTLRPLKVNALEKGVSPYGCFNMSGNVWEWCQDYYDDEFYASADSKKLNPINLKVPKYAGTKNKNTSKMTYHRIARGGGSNSEPTNLRTYVRESAYENTGSQYLGFRCCYNGKEKVIDQEDRESGETTTPEEDSTEKKNR